MPTRVPSSDSYAVGSRPPSSDKEVVTIRELIDRMARTQPEAAFLISPETGRVLTFQGLREQSNLLSTLLREAGLERGDKVAFLLENGLFSAQLFLGAMYGGFVSVPLNVRAGVSQLSYMLDHCDAKVVFVGDEFATLIAEVMAQVRRPVRVIPADLDGFRAAGETTPPATPLPVPAPEDIAVLMYTSGSTGHPKAAVHSHRTVLAGGRNSVTSHQLSSADRSLLVLPLYHINAECVTLIPTLLRGGSVVVPHRFSVSQFWDWLDEHRCTWSALVPTIIAQLLEWQDPHAGNRRAAFQRIRFLRSSSAPLAPSLHREFLDKFPLLLIQAMGSSEAGNIFSNPQAPGKNKIGSPGLPWGFEVKIADEEGGELAAGEPGEVVIRGPAVMQGYYKEPEATAAVLGPDGWLRTGDLAYRDDDGYFFVVGRSKELIIKGGVNIAPRQIDDVLESHPAVREAAAVGVPDHYLGEDLVAFVVLRAGVAADERELLAFCESRLGHFKTPTRIHFVDDLPKGPSGKAQRLRLREEAAKLATVSFASSRGESAIPPDNGQVAHPGMPAVASSIEEIIAETWREVLPQAHVDAESNFFALGGHSLLAMQCVSQLRERIPVALSLSDFFENGTVAQQTALVRRRLHLDEGQALTDGTAAAREEALQLKVAPSASPPAIPRRDPSLPCPLSTAQRRLWFIEQLNPGLPLYNEAEAARLLGELNTEALERALNAIVARHEGLRTTIQVTDNESAMVVHESWPLQLKKIDLSALAPAERQAQVERLLIEEPRRLYHLETEPAIRATLLRLAPQEHVFILMLHHILSDRSSFGIVWRELSTLYRAFCRGESFVLPPLPIHYGDYAVWQQQGNTEPASAKDLSFWTENLRGAPQLLELPADRPRPLTLSYRGAKRRFRLNPTLTKALRDSSQREKTTLFTLFTAALDTLLYRYSGQEDILLGIPIADRERPDLQSVIGFLIHTCVLRTGLSGAMTFRELLAFVQKEMLELYRHRAVPFDEVVRKLQPERNPSYSPLFQVMINWRDRNLQLPFIGLEGLVVEPLLAESRTAKLDLTLFVTDGGDEIWLEMEYSTDLFDEARIARMFGHYQTLLESVASDPGQRLSELPLLTAEERPQVLVEWNHTRLDYPDDLTLHELFEAQARRTPDQPALVFEQRTLTYGELNRQANQLAHHLRGLGVGPEVLVGLFVERSPEMLVGLLGILKAGGAYVPMDPGYPKERLGYILEDSKASIVLTEESLFDELPSFAGQSVCLDADWARIAGESEGNLDAQVKPEHLAYVLFTSGSTGRPKGVALEHRAAVNFLQWAKQVFTPQELAAVLFSTSVCFDLSVFEIFVTLSAGGKIILARNALHLPTLPAKDEVTLINTVPSAMAELLRMGAVPASVKTVNLAGEPLSDALVEQIYATTHADKVYNLYGPTETTTYSTYTLVRRGSPVTIGRPIANTQCYILDASRNPVPMGVKGELYLAGSGLARGYYGRPELTNERFVPNPFREERGGRMYRTGDLCHWLPDGNIQYLGRIDHQIKLRGFRIESGEIENVLCSHSGVREAVVVVREEGEKRLVAYVVLAGEPACTTTELRDYLKQKLPGYMVPAAWVALPALPLTPNRKIDRQALSGADYMPSEWQSVQNSVLAQTLLEMRLGQIWQQILGVRNIGVRDNFFAVGGHSLLAVRIIGEINKLLDVSLTLPTFFLNPTIEGLARVLEQENETKPGPKLIPLRPARSEGAIFFLDPSIGMLRSAELLDEGPALFAVSWLFSRAVLEAVRDKRAAKSLRLEDIAAPLAALIKGQQVSGPRVLVGYCFIGNLAFEVAHQLQRDGVRVDMIVMLDSWRTSISWWQRLKVVTRDRALWSVSWRLRYLWSIPTRLAGRVFGSSESRHTRGPTVEQEDPLHRGHVPREIQDRIARSVRRHYQCRPLEALGVLVRAREGHLARQNIIDPTHGWGDLFKHGLEFVDISSDHNSLITDAIVLDLNQVIQKCLPRLVNH
jgi:amino acid adenylation domain-containing protein